MYIPSQRNPRNVDPRTGSNFAAYAYTETSKIIVKVMHSTHYLVSNSNYDLGFKSKATS